MNASPAQGPSLAGRVRALVHGIAFGDAMGAPVEKLSASEIRARYGRVVSLDTEWHRARLDAAARNGRMRGHGIVTDDTLMTLSLMQVYNDEKRHLDAWDMGRGMVRQIAWQTRWVPELQRDCALIERLFYPEKWIFQRHQLAGCDPRQGGIGNMVNCGAAMYIAPVGAVNACDPVAAYDEAIAFASGHQQSYGLEAAGVLAAAVAAAFQPGADIDTVVQTAYALAKDGTRAAIGEIAEAAQQLRSSGADQDQVVAEFHRRIARFSPMGDDLVHGSEKAGLPTQAYQPSRLMSIEELPLALGFAMVTGGDFRAAVITGVNSGRDTDSIGVMAGAILGAMHGEAVIDAGDAAILDTANRFTLAQAAGDFAQTVLEILGNDGRRARQVQAARAAITGKGA